MTRPDRPTEPAESASETASVSGEAEKAAPTEREQRLAEALRANLRRRKGAAKKGDKSDPSP